MSEDRDPDDGGLIPKGEAEATRRLQRVHGFIPEDFASLSSQEILVLWWSFFWLNPGLHPDDAAVWPTEVSDARPLAAEAFRRYETGEVDEGDYYPADAVRHRIMHERAKGSQAQPPQHQKADSSET